MVFRIKEIDEQCLWDEYWCLVEGLWEVSVVWEMDVYLVNFVLFDEVLQEVVFGFICMVEYFLGFLWWLLEYVKWWLCVQYVVQESLFVFLSGLVQCVCIQCKFFRFCVECLWFLLYILEIIDFVDFFLFIFFVNFVIFVSIYVKGKFIFFCFCWVFQELELGLKQSLEGCWQEFGYIGFCGVWFGNVGFILKVVGSCRQFLSKFCVQIYIFIDFFGLQSGEGWCGQWEGMRLEKFYGVSLYQRVW